MLPGAPFESFLKLTTPRPLITVVTLAVTDTLLACDEKDLTLLADDTTTTLLGPAVLLVPLKITLYKLSVLAATELYV